jgi:hypothetical protein
MFIKETNEINFYSKKSKWGKYINYKRRKTLLHYKCDNCPKKFIKIRNGKYKTDALSYCKNCITSIGAYRLAGYSTYKHNVEKKFKKRIGNIVKAKDGYKEIYIGKNYPYRKGGYRCIREHVFVMENYLKRGLEKGEVVHHIDGDKTNNNLDNLFLTTIAEHNKLHASTEHIIFELVKKGKIKFNRHIGRYQLV